MARQVTKVTPFKVQGFDWAKISKPMQGQEPKPKPTYVAVVARTDITPGYAHSYSSNRHDEGWFALMGTDRERLIEDALDKVEEWGVDRYEVWLGELKERVQVPMREYKVVPLASTGSRR